MTSSAGPIHFSIFPEPCSKLLMQFVSNVLGRNVAWTGGFKKKKKKKKKNHGDLPLGLVAMATESSHRLKMGKRLNCIFYTVYVFNDQSPFLFGCLGITEFFLKKKKELFKEPILQNHWSIMNLIWYKCCLGKGSSKQLKLWWSSVGLVAMATVE